MSFIQENTNHQSIPIGDKTIESHSTEFAEQIPAGPIKFNTEAEHESPIKKHRTKLLIGAIAISGVVGLLANPNGNTEKKVIQNVAWAPAALAASEGLFALGAVGMAKGAGVRFSHKPWQFKSQWKEIKEKPTFNNVYKTGLAINTAGALGTAAVIATGAGLSLPESAWVPVIGWAAFDAFGTISTRAGLYMSAKHSGNKEPNKAITQDYESAGSKLNIRLARDDDIEKLAELDLKLFDKAYGKSLPDRVSVEEMLRKRLSNNPRGMFVSETNGEITGFVSAFLTDKPLEQFKSWEDTTNNGTLEGRVVEDGKYLYVVNMTIDRESAKLGAVDILLAKLFALGIKEGANYGYFVSRMPYFKRWASKNGIVNPSEEDALTYSESRNKRGKRIDPELGIYEKYGFKLGKPIKEAFQDEASLNFGVVCRADAPGPLKFILKLPYGRNIMSKALDKLTEKPSLLRRVI